MGKEPTPEDYKRIGIIITVGVPEETPPREVFETFLQQHKPDADVIATGPHSTEVRAKEGREVCDFCNTKPAPHVYEASDVHLGYEPALGHHVSRGDWGACDRCKALIDSNDREALVHRAIKSFREQYKQFNMPVEIRESGVRQAHAAFWKARKK